jgi:hypothetical protein
VDLVVEDLCHRPLVGGTRIFEPERHDLVAIDANRRAEGCVLFVFWRHFDLIIARITVHEGEDFIGGCMVNYDFDYWERKIIFGARLI